MLKFAKSDRQLQSITDLLFPCFEKQDALIFESLNSNKVCNDDVKIECKKPKVTLLNNKKLEDITVELLSNCDLSLEKPFIRTSSKMTVHSLRKYLAMKLKTERPVFLTVIFFNI